MRQAYLTAGINYCRSHFYCGSDFGYGNRTFRANLYAGFTAQAFIGIDRLGFAINHLINLHRAGVYAFLVTGALIFINVNLPHNSTSELKKDE
jgi:hypothetical protein